MLRLPFATIIAAIVPVLAVNVLTFTAVAADSFDAANATYEFAGDTFTLSNGEAQIRGHSGLPGAPDTLIPMGYNLAKTASGSLSADSDGAVIALYRGFGANLQWIVLFAFDEKDGKYSQTASDAAYKGDAAVESLSVDDGIVSLHLLVVSEADKQLPHYEQKPTEPLTLRFEIDNGGFAAAK